MERTEIGLEASAVAPTGHEVPPEPEVEAAAAAAAAEQEPVEKGTMSPLTGSYLLILLAEPHSEEDRQTILGRLTKGLLAWDVDSSHVDLNCELLNLTNSAPEGDEARNGEKLIQWASENLVVEVLIHSQVNTLQQCMKNLLASFTRHRHIIHAGYTFQGSGSWILQDGTFSLSDFMDLWGEPEVQRLLSAYKGDIKVSMHCTPEGGWTQDRLDKEHFSRLCQVTLNENLSNGGPNGSQPEVQQHSAGVTSFVDYLSTMLAASPVHQMLESSEIVGNIRFSRPTLYVFPGGQGDAALFGINGFNMLIDGGFARKACFWDFTRHLDRLDAVLLTRVNNNSVGGLGAVIQRKVLSQAYPQIGHFFGNVVERRHSKDVVTENENGGGSEKVRGDQLLISLQDEGQRIFENLRSINLKPHLCFRESVIEPINLYHKVGHGKLDLYILNPAKDSREVKEFLTRWYTEKSTPQGSKVTLRSSASDGKDFQFPVLNLVSICALLVWQPANPKDSITRLLFPGSTPQYKIFEALQKLKHLEFLKFPVCSAKTIAASHKSKIKSEKIISEAKSQLAKGTSLERAHSSHPPATVPRAPSVSTVQRSISSSRTIGTPPSVSRDEVQSKEDLLELQKKRRRPQSQSRSRTNVAMETAPPPKQPASEAKPPQPRTLAERAESTSRHSKTSTKPPAKTGPPAPRAPSATRASSMSRQQQPVVSNSKPPQQPATAASPKKSESKLKRPAMLPKSNNEAKKPTEPKPKKAISSRIDTGKSDTSTTAKPVIEPRKRPTTAAVTSNNRISQKAGVIETSNRKPAVKPVKEAAKTAAKIAVAGAIIAPIATKIPTPSAEDMEPQIIATRHDEAGSANNGMAKTNGVTNGSTNGGLSAPEIVDRGDVVNEAEGIEQEMKPSQEEEEQPQSLPSSCYPPLESGSELSSLDHISIEEEEEDEEEAMLKSQHSNVSTSRETEQEGPTEHVVVQGHGGGGGMESEQEEEDEYLVVEKDEVTDNTTDSIKHGKGGEEQEDEDERAATPLVVTDPQELQEDVEPNIDGEETPEIRSPVKRSIAGVGDEVEQDSLEEPVTKDEIIEQEEEEVPTSSVLDNGGDEVEVIRTEALEAAQLQRNVSELNVPEGRESSQEPEQVLQVPTKAPSVEREEEIALEKVDSVQHVPEEVGETVPKLQDLEPSTEEDLEKRQFEETEEPQAPLSEVLAEEAEPEAEQVEPQTEDSRMEMETKIPEQSTVANGKDTVEEVPVSKTVSELQSAEPAKVDMSMPKNHEEVPMVEAPEKTAFEAEPEPEDSDRVPVSEAVEEFKALKATVTENDVGKSEETLVPLAPVLENRQATPEVEQEIPDIKETVEKENEILGKTEEVEAEQLETKPSESMDDFEVTSEADQVAAEVAVQQPLVASESHLESTPTSAEPEPVAASTEAEIEPEVVAQKMQIEETESNAFKTESDKPSAPAVIQEPETEPLELEPTLEPKAKEETVAMDITEDFTEGEEPEDLEPLRPFDNIEPVPISLGDQQITEADDDEVVTTETDVPLDQQSIISEAGTEPEEDKAAFMEFQNSRGSVSSLRDELQSARRDSFDFDPVTHKSILVTEEPADSLSVEVNTTDQNIISESLTSEKQDVSHKPTEQQQPLTLEPESSEAKLVVPPAESGNAAAEAQLELETEETRDLPVSEAAKLTAQLDEGSDAQFAAEQDQVSQLAPLSPPPSAQPEALITAVETSYLEPITAPAGDMLHVKGDISAQKHEPIIPDLPADEMPSELHEAEQVEPQPLDSISTTSVSEQDNIAPMEVQVPEPEPGLEAIKTNDNENENIPMSADHYDQGKHEPAEKVPAVPTEPSALTSAPDFEASQHLSDEDSNKVAAEVEGIITTAEVETWATAELESASRKSSRQEPLQHISEVEPQEPETTDVEIPENLESIKIAGEEVRVPVETLQSLEEQIIPEVQESQSQIEASEAAETAEQTPEQELIPSNKKTEPDQDIMATAELAALATRETEKDTALQSEDQQSAPAAVSFEDFFEGPEPAETVLSSSSPPPSPESKKDTIQSVHDDEESASFEHQDTGKIPVETGTAASSLESTSAETALVPAEHVPDTEPAFTAHDKEQASRRLSDQKESRRSIDSIPNDVISAEHVVATAELAQEKVSTKEEPQKGEKVVDFPQKLTERDDKVSSPPPHDSQEFFAQPVSTHEQVAQIAPADEETLPRSIDTQLGQFQEQEDKKESPVLHEEQDDKFGAFVNEADLIPPVSQSITQVSEQPGYDMEQDFEQVVQGQEPKAAEISTFSDFNVAAEQPAELLKVATEEEEEQFVPNPATETLALKSVAEPHPIETVTTLTTPEFTPVKTAGTAEAPRTSVDAGEPLTEIIDFNAVGDAEPQVAPMATETEEPKFKIPTTADPELEQLIQAARAESPIPEPETPVPADDFLADVVEPKTTPRRPSEESEPEIAQKLQTSRYSEPDVSAPTEFIQPEPETRETEIQTLHAGGQSQEIPVPEPQLTDFQVLSPPAQTLHQVSPGTLEASIDRLHGEIDRVLDLAHTDLDQGLKREVEEIKELDTKAEDRLEHLLEQAETAVSEGLHQVEEIKALDTPTRRSLVSSPEPTEKIHAEEHLEDTLRLGLGSKAVEEITAPGLLEPDTEANLEQVLEEAQAVPAQGLEQVEEVKASEVPTEPAAEPASPQPTLLEPLQELEATSKEPEPELLSHLDALKTVLDQAQTGFSQGLETVHEVYSAAPSGSEMVPAGASADMVAESNILHDVKCQQETKEPAATTTTAFEGGSALEQETEDQEETRERADRIKEFIATSDVMIAVKDGMEKLLLRDSSPEAEKPQPAADLSNFSLLPNPKAAGETQEGQEEEVVEMMIEPDSQDKSENKFIRPLPFEETLDSQEGIEHLLREARALATIKEYEFRHDLEKIPSAIPAKLPRASRGVIRTPDEVAELPVHEEVDPTTYQTDDDVVINDVDSIICQEENDEQFDASAPPPPPHPVLEKPIENDQPLMAAAAAVAETALQLDTPLPTTTDFGLSPPAVESISSKPEAPAEPVEKTTSADQPQHAEIMAQEPEISQEGINALEVNGTETIAPHSAEPVVSSAQGSSEEILQPEQSSKEEASETPTGGLEQDQVSLEPAEATEVHEKVESDSATEIPAEGKAFHHSPPQPLSLEPQMNRLPEPVQATTSVVITPSTPPVQPDSASASDVGKSDFDYDTFVSAVSAAPPAEDKDAKEEVKSGPEPESPSDFKSSPLTGADFSVSTTTEAPNAMSDQETAVSQVVTTIPSSSLAASEQSPLETPRASSPPAQGHHKLFKLPGAHEEDGEEEEEEEYSSEKSEPTERNGMGAICSGLLTAAATLSAPVISQSAENLATLPAPGEEEATFNDKPQQLQQQELSPAALEAAESAIEPTYSSPVAATTSSYSAHNNDTSNSEQPEPATLQTSAEASQVETAGEKLEPAAQFHKDLPLDSGSTWIDAEPESTNSDTARPDGHHQLKQSPPPPLDKQEKKTESPEQTVTISPLPVTASLIQAHDDDIHQLLAGHELTHELSTLEHSKESETEEVATFSSQSFSSSSTTRGISQVIQSVHREAASVIIKHEQHQQPTDAKMDIEEEPPVSSTVADSGHQHFLHHEIIMDESGSYSSGEFSDGQLSTVVRDTTSPEGNGNVNQLIRHHHHQPEPSASSAQDVENGNYSETLAARSNVVTTTTTTTSAESKGQNGNFTTTITTTMTSTTGEIKPEQVTATFTSSSSLPSSSSTSAHEVGSTGGGVEESDDILKAWGKPLGLPPAQIDPAPPSAGAGGGATEGQNEPQPLEGSSTTTAKTPKKDQSVDRGQAGGSRSSASATPAKHHSSGRSARSHHRSTKHQSPVYLDLAYVPHHGNANYCDSEFFRLIRSRYYVLSGLEPSRQVFDGLLQGKQQWEDKNLEVTIIPTYDTDTLGYWMVDSEDALAEAHIDLAPSASRCTINLQDHETSCAAYRLEF